MAKSLTDRTLTGLLWTLFGAGGGAVMQVIVLIVLSRLLTPADFGLVAAASVVIGLSNVFVNLGVAPAIIQSRRLSDTDIRTGFTISVAMGLAIGAAMALAAPLVGALYDMEAVTPIVRALALAFPLTGLGLVAGALLRKDMQFRVLTFRNLTSYLFGYAAVSITLALLGFGVWALVFGHLAHLAMRTVQTIRASGHHVGLGFSRESARRLLTYGFGFALGRIGGFAAMQADNFVVGRLLGASALGLYGRAYQFNNLPATLLGNVVESVLFPAMSSIQDERERVARAYLRSLAVVAMAGVPVSGYLVIAGPEIIVALLGERWAEAALPFQILVASLVFRVSYKLSDSVSRSSGFILNRAWRQWVYAGCVVAGAFFGARLGGLPGVAWGVSIAIVANFAFMLQLTLKITGLSWTAPARIYGRHFAAAVAPTLVALLLIRFCRDYGSPALLSVLVSGSGAVLTWLAIARLAPRLLGEELTWSLSLVRTRLTLLRESANGRR